MTPEEQALLIRVATINRVNGLKFIFALLCYGPYSPNPSWYRRAQSELGVHIPLLVHVCLIIQCVRRSCQATNLLPTRIYDRPRLRSSLPARWLYALVVVLFVCNTLRFVLAIDNFMLGIRWPMLGSPQDSMRVKLNLSNVTQAKINLATSIAVYFIVS